MHRDFTARLEQAQPASATMPDATGPHFLLYTSGSTGEPKGVPHTQRDMLACAHCGVHIPQAEALMMGSQAYCSAEHRRMGPA